MPQMARLFSKPLKEGHPHVRLLIVIIPILDVPPPKCGIFSVAVADFSTIKAGISALRDGGRKRGETAEDDGGKNGKDPFACYDSQFFLYPWDGKEELPFSI